MIFTPSIIQEIEMVSTVQNYGQVAWQPITYKDETHTLNEWAKILGIKYSVLRMRYKRGLRGDDLFFKHGELKPIQM
jgi:hypothetical protein